MDVVYRAPELSDETAFEEAQQVMALEDFVFAFNYKPGQSFAGWLERTEAQRRGHGPGQETIAATFEVITVGGKIAGRLSVRHWLNGRLLQRGGHIGYCVLPEFRKRGFGKRLIRRGLQITAELGIADVLVTCDEVNIASRRIIEGAGGVFESSDANTDFGVPTRRYWIVQKSE